jgi:hypothetical protein
MNDIYGYDISQCIPKFKRAQDFFESLPSPSLQSVKNDWLEWKAQYPDLDFEYWVTNVYKNEDGISGYIMLLKDIIVNIEGIDVDVYNVNVEGKQKIIFGLMAQVPWKLLPDTRRMSYDAFKRILIFYMHQFYDFPSSSFLLECY